MRTIDEEGGLIRTPKGKDLRHRFRPGWRETRSALKTGADFAAERQAAQQRWAGVPPLVAAREMIAEVGPAARAARTALGGNCRDVRGTARRACKLGRALSATRRTRRWLTSSFLAARHQASKALGPEVLVLFFSFAKISDVQVIK